MANIPGAVTDPSRVRGEAIAAEVALPERAALDHRPHRAIEDEDAPGQQASDRLRLICVSSWLHWLLCRSRSTP